MRLIQSRIVTDDVRSLATFYARLIGVPAVLNDFYVEVPAGELTVGFSKCRFSEYRQPSTPSEEPDHHHDRAIPTGSVVLDFLVGNVDREFDRIDRLGVEWVLPPTTQPWGMRSMIFRDPEAHLVNVCSRLADPRDETR
jgi:hypothetical protein